MPAVVTTTAVAAGWTSSPPLPSRRPRASPGAFRFASGAATCSTSVWKDVPLGSRSTGPVECLRCRSDQCRRQKNVDEEHGDREEDQAPYRRRGDRPESPGQRHAHPVRSVPIPSRAHATIGRTFESEPCSGRPIRVAPVCQSEADRMPLGRDREPVTGRRLPCAHAPPRPRADLPGPSSRHPGAPDELWGRARPR